MKKIKEIISEVMIISICMAVLTACSKKESTENYTTPTIRPTQAAAKTEPDKNTSIYTPDGGDMTDMTNTTYTDAEVIATLTGVQYIDTYNKDSDLVLNLRDDGSCELNINLYKNITVDTGTYTKDNNLYIISFKSAGQLQSEFNNDTKDITVHYVASITDIGDIDAVLTLDKSSIAEATVPSILFSFTGSFCTFDLYDDNTYEFTNASYQIKETGIWVYNSATYKITFTKSDGSTVETSISRSDYSESFEYVSVTNYQLKDTFTCPYDVWGVLFKMNIK